MDKPSQSPITHPLMRAKKRLQSEYDKYMKSPPNNIKSKLREDKLEWHFLFIGLEGTPFEGGEYHGVLAFREDYPFSPPSIRFITPNGRFKVNERLSFEFSDLHPELWKPAYTVSGMLEGVYSFMMVETSDTVGSLSMDENRILSLARKSREFNDNNEIYKELFPIEPAVKSEECNRNDRNHELFQDHTETSYSEQTEDETVPPLQRRIKKTDNESPQNLISNSCVETIVLWKEADLVPQNLCVRKSPDETKNTILHLDVDKLEFPSTSSKKGNLGKYRNTSRYKPSNNCNSTPPFKPNAKSQPKHDAKTLSKLNAKYMSKADEYQARMD